MAQASEDGSNHQRWWEGYLVRYFLGFIVGCVCVIILFGNTYPILMQSATSAIFPSNTTAVPTPTSTPSQLSDTAAQGEKKSDAAITPLVILTGLFGIGYCYISSTPITVLHSTRMMDTWFRRHSRSFWMAWTISLTYFVVRPFFDLGTTHFGIWMGVTFVLLLSIKLRMFLVPPRPSISSHPRIVGIALVYNIGMFTFSFMVVLTMIDGIGIINTALFAFSLPALWILVGQYWTLMILLRDENKKFFDFYKKISRARQKHRSRDIRDSYTHLREHANAIFVVLIELCILAGLLCISDFTKTYLLSTPKQFVTVYPTTILLLTGIWLVPTVFMWGLANRLEQEFSEHPTDFLDDDPSTL
jgi:hypothetical protein